MCAMTLEVTTASDRPDSAMISAKGLDAELAEGKRLGGVDIVDPQLAVFRLELIRRSHRKSSSRRESAQHGPIVKTPRLPPWLTQPALYRFRSLLHCPRQQLRRRLCGMPAMRERGRPNQTNGSTVVRLRCRDRRGHGRGPGRRRVRKPAKSHDLRSRAIAQSFCPYRARCSDPLSLASALSGRVRVRIQGERRASGEFVRVELTTGHRDDRAGVEAEPVLYCTGLRSAFHSCLWPRLLALHELLMALESRLPLCGRPRAGAGGGQSWDEADARARDGSRSEPARPSRDSTAPARPRSRRRGLQGMNRAQRSLHGSEDVWLILLLKAAGMAMQEAGDDHE